MAAEWPEDDLAGSVATDLPAPEPSADGAKKGATVLTYDVGTASEFAYAIFVGASSWNDRVPNVTLRKAPPGQKPDIQFTASNGWPGAEPSPLQLGKGKITIGRKAVNQGHDSIRRAAHEFGHLLGLPDEQPGSCSRNPVFQRLAVLLLHPTRHASNGNEPGAAEVRVSSGCDPGRTM